MRDGFVNEINQDLNRMTCQDFKQNVMSENWGVGQKEGLLSLNIVLDYWIEITTKPELTGLTVTRVVKQVPAGYSIDFRAFYSLQLDYSKLIGQSAQDKCQTAYKGLAIRQDKCQTTIFTSIQQGKRS